MRKYLDYEKADPACFNVPQTHQCQDQVRILVFLIRPNSSPQSHREPAVQITLSWGFLTHAQAKEVG